MTLTAERTYTAAVAAEIRAWMGRRGLNQRDVCARLGVTPMWLSRRLSGGIVIDVEDLRQLARVLDAPISDLLPRLDSNQQPFGDLSSQVSAHVLAA